MVVTTNSASCSMHPQSCLLQEQKWIWNINGTSSRLVTNRGTQMQKPGFKALPSVCVLRLLINQLKALYVFGSTVTWFMNHESWRSKVRFPPCVCMFQSAVCSNLRARLPVPIHTSHGIYISCSIVPENRSVVRSLNFSLQQVWMAS